LRKDVSERDEKDGKKGEVGQEGRKGEDRWSKEVANNCANQG
jgi:hypothetical protein